MMFGDWEIYAIKHTIANNVNFTIENNVNRNLCYQTYDSE